MLAKPEITISLISYNQCHDLERLLPSLMPAAQLAAAEVLLVAHRCDDGTINFVKSNFPEVKITPNGQRAGYGENHNINLAQARGRYFTVMNSDMVINQPEIFVRLREYLDEHPDVGMVCPKILNADGTVQGLNKRYPTLFDFFLRRCAPRMVQRLFRRRMEYYEMRDVGYDTEYDVEFMSGAFMFCRTAMLQSLGGFDTGYFLYLEDADLSRRVQQCYRTVYHPQVSIIHIWRRSSHTNLKYTRYFLQSMRRYFQTWGFKLA